MAKIFGNCVEGIFDAEKLILQTLFFDTIKH
jgi:hypothetical protein